MMFDLNFDDEEKQSEELSNTSSSSSVVNAAADDHRVTHQLFPTTTTTAASSDRVIESPEFTTTTNEWLKLSVSSSCSGSGSGLGSDKQQQVRKSRRGPRSRSSQYRGVTFYRRTGRWESHIWDCGKQVYLGGFDTAHTAARAYDRAAIQFRGVEADINFNITDYEEDMKQVKNMSKEEFVQVLRRQTTGLSRGNSRVRGITLPKCGLWEAPMVQFLGNNGYDHAATVQCNSRENVTNFEPKSYDEQTPILVNNEGHGHNLDLNLGISVTIDGSTTSNNMGVAESRITHGYSVQLSNGKRAMNKASPYHSPGAVPLYGQPMVYRQPTSMWSALSHGRTATHEERVSEQKNFPMYMASLGQGDTVKQVQILPRAAASSGFPFSTATTSNTLFTHHQHSQGRQ